MVWKTSYNAALGVPALALATVDSIQRFAVGGIVKGFDDLLGEGEFIYLPGVAGTVAGDSVVYDLLPGGQTTVRATAGGQPNGGHPFAVAVTAVGAGSFGWFQIAGVCPANVVAGTAIGRAFLSATAGQLTSTAAAGVQVIGGRISSAVGTPAAGQAYVTLNRPMVQPQIT